MKNTIKFILLLSALGGFSGNTYADGADEPIPSFYQEPGISRTRDYVNQHANERIDPFTGKLQWHYVDLMIPGNGGFDLKVQRSYTSIAEEFPAPSTAGIGWTMHFGRVLRTTRNNTGICDQTLSATRNPVLELPDGSRQVLYNMFDGMAFISTSLWKATCLLGGAGGLSVFSPDGTRYDMNVPGAQEGNPTAPTSTYYVSQITDRNGNTMSFTYDFVYSNLLFGVKTVTTSDGRSLAFDYHPNGTVKSITDGSRVWNYVYEPSANMMNSYFLKEVQRPDGRAWKYDYHLTPFGTPGSSSISRVTYPTGGTIDYTYDFVNFATNPSIPRSTVVKQKIASPGGTWNWIYTPATQHLVANSGSNISVMIPPPADQAEQLDRTTVTGPDESKTYYHAGYNSAFPGITYLIGFMLGTSSALQNEAYGVSPMDISPQTNLRPGGTLVFDNATSMPLVTWHSVGRPGESFSTSYGNFDDAGNPQTIAESGNKSRTTNLTYYIDPDKWILRQKKDEIVSSDGETLSILRSFDPNANLLSETRAGVKTSYTYTAAGDVETKTDPRLKTTSYFSYYRGIARTENQPEGVTIARTVSPAGNVLSETDGELATTGFTYDDLNRVTGITHPIHNPVSVVWGTNTRTVARGAYREVQTFDGFGRAIQVQHTSTGNPALSVVQNFKVDSLGRRVYASYPNAAIGTGYAYDLLNRVRFVFNEYDPATENWTSYRRNTYQSYQTQLLNERNYQYVYSHRYYADPDKGELMAIKSPLDASAPGTTITRNIAGQITSVTQDGVQRLYGYDSRFYLTSVTEPEVANTIMARDDAGNMLSKQVDGAGLTGYVYDDRNRVKEINYPSGTPSVVKTYYKDDKLKSVDNGIAVWSYLYDGNKNLTDETLTVGGKSFLTKYAYNSNDALDALTYGSGRAVNYFPDAFGRPQQAAPYVTSVAYHPTGEISAISYANGIRTNVGLNTRQWPSTLNIGPVSGNKLFDMTYGYDAVGNVSSIGNSVDGSYNRGMTYDGLDRLTGIDGPWGSGSIGYDLRGNVRQQSLGSFSLTYAYDSATHRLSTISGSKTYSMQYDVFGNVTGNGMTTFAYNDAANMRCANCGQAGEILYDYDGMNQRVRKQKDGIATYFVYGQGGKLLWEETPNNVMKEYIYLGGKQIAVREQKLQ